MIALQGTPTLAESSAATSLAVAYPAGIVANDLLVLSLTLSQQTALTTVPSGWTLAKAQDAVGGTYTATTVFYKKAVGGETGTVTVGTWTTSGRTTAIMSRWAGVDTVTALDTAPVSNATADATTLLMPSITTTTANCVLLHTIAANVSSTSDLETLAGTTLVTKSTTIGRKSGQFYEQQPTPGASGTRLWTLNPVSPRLWTGITLALRTSGSVIAPSLVQRVVGIPATNTATTALVQAKVTNATSARLKVSTDPAGTQGVVYGPAATPSASGDVKLTASGLTANTRYYYRVAMTNAGGEVLDTSTPVGRLKTAPSGASSFSFCFASCFNGTDTAVVDAVAARGDDMFMIIGDLYYADGSGTTAANFRTKHNQKILAYQSALATTNTVYTPSDHDGMNNDSTAGGDATAWTNWNTVRSELWPAAASYYSWTWGRVRFIVLDDRSFKTIPSATDNSSKTALGATQKTWLKNTITAATEPVIVIAQSAPWIHPPEAGDDGWNGYTTERTELANFFVASGKKIVMLAGDMHAVAADSGVNSPGGVPLFHASPGEGTSSHKGGPYTVPPYPASGQSATQYGRVVVTDTGAQISLTFSGYSAPDNTQRVTLTVTETTGGGGTTPGGITPVSQMFIRTATAWVPISISSFTGV
ncbi:MAG TPA: alkaline phosphatase D family protein [Arthrobacter sp.]